LLKTFDASGKRTDIPSEGGHTRSQNDVAREAGLSKHQQLQAVRLANVPAEQFDTQIEGEKPPSISTAFMQLPFQCAMMQSITAAIWFCEFGY